MTIWQSIWAHQSMWLIISLFFDIVVRDFFYFLILYFSNRKNIDKYFKPFLFLDSFLRAFLDVGRWKKSSCFFCLLVDGLKQDESNIFMKTTGRTQNTKKTRHMVTFIIWYNFKYSRNNYSIDQTMTYHKNRHFNRSRRKLQKLKIFFNFFFKFYLNSSTPYI